MIRLRVRDVVEATGARRVSGDPLARIAGVSTDTRTLQAGQLFVALAGPNFDGNRYAAQALEGGAAALLLRSEPPGSPGSAEAGELPPLPPGLPVLVAPDPRWALAQLASWHRRRLDVPVLGITGSCGKTTTKNMLVELLADHLAVGASPASFNNDVGVPHTVLAADEDTECLLVEMGTNAPGEIAELCRVARPTCGVITNVGASHLERLGSLAGVAREKGALAAAVGEQGFVVLNADCRWTPELRGMTRARAITFSIDGGGDVAASDVWFHAAGTTFTLNHSREVTLPLLGLHTVQNLLAALAACLGLGLDLDDVLPAVGRLRDGRRRMERREVGGLTLFDDTHNANPDSARASVRVLAGLHGFGRRVLVLGDMLELGGHSAAGHTSIGRLAATSGVDRLVLVGELVEAAAEGARSAGMPADAVLRCADHDEALERLGALLVEGDVVLVKGSRATGMERLVEALIDQRTGGPPTLAEVRGG